MRWPIPNNLNGNLLLSGKVIGCSGSLFPGRPEADLQEAFGRLTSIGGLRVQSLPSAKEGKENDELSQLGRRSPRTSTIKFSTMGTHFRHLLDLIVSE